MRYLAACSALMAAAEGNYEFRSARYPSRALFRIRFPFAVLYIEINIWTGEMLLHGHYIISFFILVIEFLQVVLATWFSQREFDVDAQCKNVYMAVPTIATVITEAKVEQLTVSFEN